MQEEKAAERDEAKGHLPVLHQGQRLTQQQELDDLVRRVGLRWKVKATGRGGPPSPPPPFPRCASPLQPCCSSEAVASLHRPTLGRQGHRPG